MKYFHYSGSGDQGVHLQGWLMASDREDAIAQLRGRGIHPFSIKPGPGHIALKVDEDELLVSMRELASLRRSGMAIDDAAQAIVETSENKPLIKAWRKVVQMVRSGASLSDSFAAVPDAFPSYSVHLIKLGEANGELAEAITIVANRLEEESSLKSEVRAALAYPAFLLVVSLAVVLFLFVSVVPNFGSMVADTPEELGGSMRVLLGIASILTDYFWLWLTVFILFVGLIVYFWREGRIQSYLWNACRRVPGVTSVVEAWEVVQFCNSMARLLGGRVSILDSVRLSAETIGRDELRRGLFHSCDLVRQGETLGSALSEAKIFPKLVAQMIAVGEKSSHLADAMNEISVLYTRRMRENIRKALSILEPAVIALMGVVVGGIITSLLTAIMSMNDIPL